MNMRDAVRVLRRAQTPAERRLWGALRNRQLAGLRFRRQYPVGRFIADFYCYEARLVVEVDGGVHAASAQAAYDRERDDLFASLGLSVIRVSNGDVLDRLPLVLDRIRTAAQLSQPR